MRLNPILLASLLISFASQQSALNPKEILSGHSTGPTASYVKDSVVAVQQNPSPMVEYTRAHGRITKQDTAGVDFELSNVLPKEIDVFIPRKSLARGRFDLLIHFHGTGNVVRYAATRYPGAIIAASVTLGSGSGVYGRAFTDSTKFPIVIDSIRSEVERHLHHQVVLRHIILSGWSAGYGAIREIINTTNNYRRVSAVLLLDGIHASYIPDGRVLSAGGKIDSTDLQPFLRLAEDASHSSSQMKFLITHSEIFPGTFVSTTESSQYLIQKLGMKETAVLRWGPLGMQQLSVAHRGHFAIWGFAGNTAPDHIDHFQGLCFFLQDIRRL